MKTKTKAKTTSGTKLALATLVMLAAAGAAYATLPLQRINYTPCLDSDGGRDYNTRGAVTFGSVSSTDLCVNTTTLSEKFCNTLLLGKAISTENHVCENRCQEGACVRPERINVTASVSHNNINCIVASEMEMMEFRLMSSMYEPDPTRDVILKSVSFQLQGSSLISEKGTTKIGVSLFDEHNRKLGSGIISRVVNGITGVVEIPVEVEFIGSKIFHLRVDTTDPSRFLQYGMDTNSLTGVLASFKWSDGLGEDLVAGQAQFVPQFGQTCLF